MNMSYKYVDPVENGFMKFKLTKRQHNILFKNRKKKLIDKYDYYYNDKAVIMFCYTNWIGILFVTCLFPLSFLLHGFANTKQMCKELKEFYNQKKYGNYESDQVPSNTLLYDDIMYAIKLNSR